MPIDFLQACALVVATGFVSWSVTGRVRRFALERDVMDIPNERSSHSRPTPRGGGVAIVASFLLAIATLAALGVVEGKLVRALLGGGMLVAAVGFADDRWGLPARLRFGAHLTAALWVIYSLWPLAPVSGFGLMVRSDWVLVPAIVLFIAWFINFFNFMDGIDGIASIETIAVCVGGTLLSLAAAIPAGGAPTLALAGAVTGFLFWNWPPARIFMGDAGSGFLGLIVATLALWQAGHSPQLFWSWLILVGCFMVDSTTTLLRRVRRGEHFHVAHRSHAYQFAARKCGAHLPVTLACGAITVFWLSPFACAVALQWLDGALGLVIAYAPLVRLAYLYRAGDTAAQAKL